MKIEKEQQSLFPSDYQNRFHIYYDLMKERVQEVLLVSTLYDDFILEEDGHLTEELIEEFSRLNLSAPPPRITRVSSATEAFDAIKQKEFDLIITMRRLTDMDPFQFGRQVKRTHPHIPTVLLLTNHSDTIGLPDYNQREGIDLIFTWNGDSDLILAMIKLIEDIKNVDSDTHLGHVRVIIVIEDTIQYYSIFLPIIYKELLKQTQDIIEEGLNLSHRLLRRKGRPKILLAQTYEQAIELYQQYNSYLLGIITDVAYPLGGKKDYSAGVKLIDYIREKKPYLPVLMQSSDPENRNLAESHNVWFVHKNSVKYLREFRKFMKQSMLFGDFVFCLPSGKEVGRAKNVAHFERVIKTIPLESIRFHGSNNHFSNWLFSRGEYDLANKLAPYEIDEFDSIEQIRTFLLESFEKRRKEKHQGVITEFSMNSFDFSAPFTKIGNGSLGGKGRGLAFISALISKGFFSSATDNILISIPETVVIGTDIYDTFLEKNELFDLLTANLDDESIKSKFIAAALPSGLQNRLRKLIEITCTPLAVRSSSLLEDSQFHPLAGIYKTYMLSNDQDTDQERFDLLCQAVKLVYASTFSNTAKSYINSMGQKIEVEKMAVVIQKVVGKMHDNYFYPDFSGVVRSYNYYPISYMKPEDGIAEVAVGLGEMVVSGGQSLQFSPEYPKILPQASTVDTALDNTQREFLAIALKNHDVDLKRDEFSTLEKLDLSIAKNHGSLKWLASSFDYQNNRIIDSDRFSGALLITFPYILKYPKFPLADILRDLLLIGEETLGIAVEIEFAVNLDYEKGEQHRFYILQIRPLAISETELDIGISIPKDQGIVRTEIALGHGITRNIEDIVYVDPNTFDKTKTLEIREEISILNKKFREMQREYILIGPGRWGTRDNFLGIPVIWSDIDQARVIVEMGYEDFQIEPSQGSHFFLNITSTKRGYFTIPYNSDKAFIDSDWIENQVVVEQLKYVKHVKSTQPLDVKIDGKTGIGVILPTSSNGKEN